MLAFVLRRLLWGVLIVFGVITMTIFSVEAAPGDPFAHLESPHMTKETLERIKEKWGYGPEYSAWDRYRLYMEGLLTRGDLGISIHHNRAVGDILPEKLFNTIQLTIVALILNFTIGIFIGVVGALRRRTALDHTLTVGSLFLYSMPSFWLSLMLALVFAVMLGWFPRSGIHSPGETGLWDLLKHLALPSISLGIAAAAGTARFQRSALLEVVRQDYIRTARAKGLPERSVVLKHAMRNALLPTITLFGLSLPFLFSGAIITESIFAWPGMGTATIDAIHARDVPMVTGVTIVLTSMVVAGSLLADICYAIVDPRVRLS